MEILIDYRDDIGDKSWEEDIHNACERTLVHLGMNPEDYEVSISFVGDEEIRELNNEYREKDSVTDVLSFPMEMDFPIKPMPLGDVVINLDRAKQQAEEYGHSVKRELIYLLVHSILHLNGFDHEDEEDKAEMRLSEEAIMGDLDLNRG
ncbi:MAG: rRNA maturation RNase YbeY [Tissierellia bacterium]|nr:rRNA maturation RNase YbeY [Tissierellia bacterium]